MLYFLMDFFSLFIFLIFLRYVSIKLKANRIVEGMYIIYYKAEVYFKIFYLHMVRGFVYENNVRYGVLQNQIFSVTKAYHPNYFHMRE